MYTITNDDGIVTLTLAMPGKVNKINRGFAEGLSAGLDEALAVPGRKGIILASGHRDFCVGADLDMIYALRDAAEVRAVTAGLNALLRRLETCGVPVVAALTGSALGGGCEVALACHHRVALDAPNVQIGLPEVNLGVIPGGGGTQRLPRIIGIQAALEIIAQAQILRAAKAKKVGLVDTLAPTVEGVFEAARAWILANPGAKQPWDRGGKPPGVQPGTEEARNLLLIASAMLAKKTAGNYPAAEAAIRAVSDGLAVNFDTGVAIEGRHFAKLVVSDQAKDMIRTFWYHKNAVERQEGLPRIAEARFQKVAILGAGMMGAGLGFVCAQRGYTVVLKDIREEALVGARAHCEGQAAALKHLPEAERAAILGRITYTLDLQDLVGTDLVIEAVVEDVAVKARVTAEVEALLGEDAVFASNTSAIPISILAKASKRPANFVGMHFFSPVEKMPLLEIIVGKETSEETVARALAFGSRIKKTNIVVNDGYGFFTTRLFASYILEGCQLVAEGHDPVLVEWAGRKTGMVVSPLKEFDEVTLTLGLHAFESRGVVTGKKLDLAGVELVRRMVKEHGRTGKAGGKGFYEYEGERRIWPGLRDLATGTPAKTGVDYLARRLMLIQAAEVARALDEGIVRNWRDAEVGAIFGVGFAPNTGGPLAWMDRQGLPALVEELRGLATELGERYTPAPMLVQMAERGERFFREEAAS
ncbi:MAG: 3-hydroxyacyl-CoA dehydrogenase NAD-binding domain-containing protein [Myxococcota bacterium]